MILYKLTTQKLGDYYVVDVTIDMALQHLNNLLSIAKYGFSDDREVTHIEIIAKELYFFPENVPNFSSKNRLILPDTCKINE